jgi:HEPN domain-containing protein
MAKKRKTTSVSREEARAYLEKAMEFHSKAITTSIDESWNAAGLLAVHSAISAADSLLAFSTGLRSTAQDHKAVVNLMKKQDSGSAEWATQANRLGQIVARKNVVEYEGRLISEKDARYLVQQAGRFLDWVKGQLP